MNFLNDKKDIQAWLDKYKVKNYTIEEDLGVNIDSPYEKALNLCRKNLNFIPIRFKRVIGDIDVSHNLLTTLSFAPALCHGSFDCSFNRLKSLEFGPQEVIENFDCSFNELETLEFAPRFVGQDFRCSKNHLISLKGAPYETRDFVANYNRLENLIGCPKTIRGRLDCINDRSTPYGLTSLVGAPHTVGHSVDLSGNRLQNLEFCPEKIYGPLALDSNDLSSLEFFPSLVVGDVFIGKNPTFAAWEMETSFEFWHEYHTLWRQAQKEKEKLEELLKDNIMINITSKIKKNKI